MAVGRTLFVGAHHAVVAPNRWSAVIRALARASAGAGLSSIVIDDHETSLAAAFVGEHETALALAPGDAVVQAYRSASRAESVHAAAGAGVVGHVYDEDVTGSVSMHTAILDDVTSVVIVGGNSDHARIARIASSRGVSVFPLRSLGGAARTAHDAMFAGPASDPVQRAAGGEWTAGSAAADAAVLARALSAAGVVRPPRSYFISYPREEAEVADGVEVLLHRLKRRVFRDEDWFKGGRELASEIIEAIAMADDFIVVDSYAAAASEWVQKEVAFAYAMQARRGDRMRVVGILTQGHPPKTALDATKVHLLGADRSERRIAIWGLVESEPTLPLSLPPAKNEAADKLASVSATLIEWPRTLRDGTVLERPELNEIVAALGGDDPAVLLVLGVPGSGKSALLAQLAVLMQQEGREVVAIKADRLPRHVDSVETLSVWAGVRSIVESLRAASADRPTLLLLDQLDSLGSLVDLETGRLGAVLDLIAQVDGMPNVRVVASCRPFEFHHDARFARLRATAINLALPPWSEVEATVARGGHDVGRIPPRLRALLCVPQYLKVFLDLATPALETTTYEAMLEELWRQRVVGDAQRVALIARIAERIADDEEPIVPAAIADDEPMALEQLLAANILRRDGSGIAFAHQTLFEFARARVFGQGGETLDAFVLRRQEGLFVRPMLWTALSYLRGARPSEYRRVYRSLFENGAVRQHIRVLLAEFLGQVDEPNDAEVGWFREMLSEPLLRRAAIVAMAGSRSWFAALNRSLMLSLLEAPYATEFTGVLSDAASTDPAAVVGLLKSYAHLWPSGDRLAVQILRSLAAWDDDAIAFAASVVPRVEEPWAVEGLISAAVDREPEAGIRILAGAISAKLDRAIASTVVERDAWRSARARAVAGALGLSEALVDWAAVAANAPRVFAEAFLPLVIRAVDAAAASRSGPRRPEYSVDTVFDTGDEPASKLVSALEQALRSLARHDVATLDALLPSAVRSSAMAIQRIVARVYIECARAGRVASAVTYLLEDPRRFAIGAGTESDGATLELLGALAPLLSTGEVGVLERAIHASVATWPLAPDASPRDRWRRLRWTRRCRARLLNALPQAELSAESRQMIREHPVEVDSPDRSSSGLRLVPSAMTSKQMARAKDEDVLNLFDVLTDDTMWRHPRRDDVGGAIEAARALAALSKTSPDRLAALVLHFHPGKHEVPAGEVLAALAKSGWRPDAWEALVLEMDRRGFSKVGFREDVARGITEHANRHRGASDALVAMLMRWLVTEAAPDDVESLEGRARVAMPSATPTVAPSERRPILSGYLGVRALPHGSYPVLRAIYAALMGRPEPATERWLAILEAHLEREPSDEVWTAVAFELPQAWRLDDKVRVERFLDAVLARHASILDKDAGAVLLAHSLSFVSSDFLARWLGRLRHSELPFGRQLAGELGVYASLRGLPTVSSEDRLAADDASVDERAGIAFAVGSVWDHAVHRTRTTGLILRTMRDADASVQAAALRVFLLRDELPNDAASAQLLDELVARDELMACVPEELCGALSSLLPGSAARVADVAAAFVRAAEEERRQILMDAGPALVDLALTLQRLDLYRVRGVDLFERLQRLGVHGVAALLFDLDGRVRRTPALVTPRRRFPRKRRT